MGIASRYKGLNICSKCGGFGYITLSYKTDAQEIARRRGQYKPCSACKGSGKGK